MKTQHPANREDGFTLTEFFVVTACLGLLILTVLPALAGGRDKATRLQCADNLRQLHAASVQFANENDNWLPCWIHPVTGQTNVMSASRYCRYVWIGQPYRRVEPSPTQPAGAMFQNAGHLFAAGLIGEGRVLYCPSTVGGSLGEFGAEPYEPLVTSDASGAVRCSYNYNPMVVDPLANSLRRFQKTTEFEPHRLFVVDLVGSDIVELVHESERGWNVLFTDGTVQFSQSEAAYQFVSQGGIGRYDNIALQHVFDLLERER